MNNTTTTATAPVSTQPSYEEACESATKPWLIVYSIFLVLIMFTTLLGNVLVVTAVYLTNRLHRMTNYFIVSLAVSDLLVALVHLPLRIDQSVHNFNWCFDRNSGITTCTYWIVSDTIFSSASICNLAVISIDRFLAITKPFSYQNIMTKKVGASLIAFVWIYSSLWGILSLINWTQPSDESIFVNWGPTNERYCTKNDPVYYTVAMSVAFFLPLLIIIITYSCVFRVAYTHAKAMASHDPSRSHRNVVRELKATKMVAVVIGAFILCWLPSFTLIVISLWCVPCMKPFQDSEALSYSIRIVFIFVLPVMNSCINPLIYAVFNKEFRVAFKRMLSRFVGRDMRGNGTEDFSMTEHSHISRTNSATSSRSSRAKSLLGMKNLRNKLPN